jgi:hypothetical protein
MQLCSPLPLQSSRALPHPCVHTDMKLSFEPKFGLKWRHPAIRVLHRDVFLTTTMRPLRYALHHVVTLTC